MPPVRPENRYAASYTTLFTTALPAVAVEFQHMIHDLEPLLFFDDLLQRIQHIVLKFFNGAATQANQMVMEMRHIIIK